MCNSLIKHIRRKQMSNTFILFYLIKLQQD